MLRPSRLLFVLSVGTIVFGATTVLGQTYPTKPIRFVTGSVGSGNDFIARLVAQGISAPLGQPVIVDNRPGLAFVTGQHVSMSQPDGYTVLVGGPGLWLSQFLRSDVPYDVEKDFAAISTVDRSPLLLVVHPSLPINSVKDLIAYAKAKPGQLSYSTGGTGSTSHLAPELFKFMTGVNMVRVPYKSGTQEILDLVSGEVQLTFSTGQATPHAKAGKLRALAHTGDQPSTLYPGLPTVAATVPGYRAVSFTAMFVPAKTPAAVIKRLNQETVRFLSTPELKERLFNNGTEPGGCTPEELAAAIKAEVARWGKVIKGAGITTE